MISSYFPDLGSEMGQPPELLLRAENVKLLELLARSGIKPIDSTGEEHDDRQEQE
jgi:hypothetical protein